MSRADSEAGPTVTINDDDGVVDKATKEHILSLRKQIDDDERQLYVEARAGHPRGLDIEDANRYWGISVRQYLRGIKRLWDDDSDETQVRKVHHYWGEREIGSVTLVPPDTQQYQFSIAERSDLSDSQLRRRLGLPPQSELPRPHTEDFRGLRSVLDATTVSKQWVVTLDASGPPPEHEKGQLQREIPVPKHILEQAVEVADNFLQQAGIGFDTTVPDYMGGDEPGL